MSNPRNGPHSMIEWFYLPPPQWLLPHPECWPIYSLYNDALYKIEKLSFTKDSLEKRNIQVNNPSIKKENNILNVFPKQNIVFTSTHSKFTCIYNT